MSDLGYKGINYNFANKEALKPFVLPVNENFNIAVTERFIVLEGTEKVRIITGYDIIRNDSYTADSDLIWKQFIDMNHFIDDDIYTIIIRFNFERESLKVRYSRELDIFGIIDSFFGRAQFIKGSTNEIAMDSVDIQKWKLMDAEPINGKNITEVLESNTDSPISINFEVWFGNFLNKPIRLLSQTPTMFVKDYDGRMVHSNPVQTRLYSYMLINYDDLTLNMTYDFSFDQRKLENDIKVESLHSYNQ